MQAINYTGSQSAQTTNAIGASTQQVRIASPIAGYNRVDASNAVVGDSYLPANWVEWVACTPRANPVVDFDIVVDRYFNRDRSLVSK